MVTDKLYYSIHPFTNEVSTGFSFDEDVIKEAILRIYEKQFNPITEIDKKIFRETWQLFDHATDQGFGKRDYSDPDYEFYEQIRYNNAVFSAFRTHRLQNDIAAQLLDDKGKLKPFERFAEDVAPIVDHNVKQWLRTEYNTAILRAHQAADWVRFGQVKDILPNLRWMPTTSVTPDSVHKRYWEVRLTLSQDHPFWNAHRPGDRWNCKCRLEPTDDPEHGKHVIDDKNYIPDKGLDNNPGVDAKLFSDTHPYIEHANKGAQKAVEIFLEKVINSFATKEKKQQAKSISFLKAKKNALQKLKTRNKSLTTIVATNLQSGKFYDSKKGLKALLNHSITNDEIKAAMALPKNISNLEFVRVSPLGEGKDLSNPIDAENVDKKKNQGVVQYNIYKYEYKKKVYYIKMAQFKKGREMVYSYTKKP